VGVNKTPAVALDVQGTVNATTFIGNGSLLTGVSTVAVTPNYTGNVSINGVLDMQSNKITNLLTPVNGTDAATKAYVDAAGGSGKLSGEGNFTDTCANADAIGAKCNGGYKAGDHLIVQPAGCPTVSFTSPACTDTVDRAKYYWNDGTATYYDIPGVDTVDDGSDSHSGSANTTVLAAYATQQQKAARYCDQLVLNGQSDWFLPNLGELEQIYKSRKIGTGSTDGLRGFAATIGRRLSIPIPTRGTSISAVGAWAPTARIPCTTFVARGVIDFVI
jgi:hypothetical protein